jgi:hypothetical protein
LVSYFPVFDEENLMLAIKSQGASHNRTGAASFHIKFDARDSNGDLANHDDADPVSVVKSF